MSTNSAGGQRLGLRLVSALLLLALLLTFFLLGRDGFGVGFQRNRDLAQQVEQLQAELVATRQRAVVAETSAVIDRQAAETVRVELVDYRRQIAELQRDVDFYRGLMAPDESEKGLAIHELALERLADGGYQYRVTVKQSGGGNVLLNGELQIHVMEAVEGDEQQAKARKLGSFPGFQGKLPAKLRFRFFQKIEGSFKLPEGYVPVSIKVSAHSRGKSPQRVEREFRWQQLIGEL